MQAPSHLVAEFRQRPLVASKPQDMSYGMCVGFSTAWVLRHRNFKSEGPKQRCDHLKSDTAVTGAETMQRSYLGGRSTADNIRSTGQRAAINTAFTSVSSAVSIAATETADIYPEGMKEALQSIFVHTSGIHRYFLCVLSFGESALKVDTDNHVIAGYHSGGKFRGWGSHLYVFEPNFGEFRLSGGEVKTFFEQIRAAYLGYVTKAGEASPKKLQLVTIHKLAVP